jgi:hypothetical protein
MFPAHNALDVDFRRITIARQGAFQVQIERIDTTGNSASEHLYDTKSVSTAGTLQGS